MVVLDSAVDQDDDVAWIDLDPHAPKLGATRRSVHRPSWRSIAVVIAVICALALAYGLGRSDGRKAEAASEPSEPPPPVTDVIGEGEVIGELELRDGGRAVLWCREAVPGTQIPSTLALLHVEPADGFGDQLVSYEELTTPWIPRRGSWRGGEVDLEGFAPSTGPAEGSETETVGTDGSRCASCAPERATIEGSGTILYGDCLHGVPFGAGIAYVVASPASPGQTPLAIHLSCGITSLSLQDGGFLVEAEVPLMRGLTDARFRLPSVALTYSDARFWADDLNMLAWACDADRSTQLGDRHLLPEGPAPRIEYDQVESAVGPIGVRGALLVGLDRDQCSRLTRAWWGAPPDIRDEGRPVADLVDLDPPAGIRDWVYTCQPE